MLSLPFKKEIILVDDGSTDSYRRTINSLDCHPNILFLHHAQRMGKGAAVQTGLQAATGDIVVIQDADLEYDPADIIPLVKLIELGKADVAYGIRDLSSQRTIIKFGNRFLTWMINKLYGQSILDMTTCYKAMRIDVMNSLELKSRKFSIDAEITTKLFRIGYTIAETPISYKPRYVNKKLKIWDGIPMLWTILKYRFWKPIVDKSFVHVE
ncbi:MAG: glycosyltransferase family 2 protein [Gammaproteobacteria bacterium]|nr:glycosyltransferase family 2 protein [Gammaproteobacteria bacterium]